MSRRGIGGCAIWAAASCGGDDYGRVAWSIVVRILRSGVAAIDISMGQVSDDARFAELPVSGVAVGFSFVHVHRGVGVSRRRDSKELFHFGRGVIGWDDHAVRAWRIARLLDVLPNGVVSKRQFVVRSDNVLRSVDVCDCVPYVGTHHSLQEVSWAR